MLKSFFLFSMETKFCKSAMTHFSIFPTQWFNTFPTRGQKLFRTLSIRYGTKFKIFLLYTGGGTLNCVKLMMCTWWYDLAGTFFGYAFVCAAAIVFIIMVVPETKGQTLEEIQASMNRWLPCRSSELYREQDQLSFSFILWYCSIINAVQCPHT